MKFMLPVVYFNNTKSEVKITLKKIRTGSHSFSYCTETEESSL